MLDTVTEAEDDRTATVGAEERLDEFKRFLDDVDPEDFRG